MTALRLQLIFFYTAIFASIGTKMPYWSLWLQDRGITLEQIGILLALPVLTKIICSPYFAALADKRGARKPILIWLSLGGVLSTSLFILVDGFWSFFALSLLFGIFWAPVMSFGDAITLSAIKKTPLDYGRIRLFGSLSFIVFVFSFGLILENWGGDSIYWGVIVTLGLTVLSIFCMPNPTAAPPNHKTNPLKSLLTQKPFLIFLVCVLCINGSHALYNSFSSIHWRSLGYSDSMIGFFWALAIFAEILFFAFAKRFERRLSCAGFLIIAAVAATLRWLLYSFDLPFEGFLAGQLLHALSFGALHMGGITYIKQTIDPSFTATAQSLYGAAAFGVGAGFGMLASGFIYSQYQAQGFLIMTLLAFFGTLCALFLHRNHSKPFHHA